MVLGFLWIFLLGLHFFLVSGPLQCLQFTTRCNPLKAQQVKARQRSRRLCHDPTTFQEDYGLWINGVRVDVAGRIAPKRAAQSKETAEARQSTKQGPAAVDLLAMD